MARTLTSIIYGVLHQNQSRQVSGPYAHVAGVGTVSGSAYHRCGKHAAWPAASRSGSDEDEQPCCVGTWTLFHTSGTRAARRRIRRRVYEHARASGLRCGTFYHSANTASPVREDLPPVGSRLFRWCHWSLRQHVLGPSCIQLDRQLTRV